MTPHQSHNHHQHQLHHSFGHAFAHDPFFSQHDAFFPAMLSPIASPFPLHMHVHMHMQQMVQQHQAVVDQLMWRRPASSGPRHAAPQQLSRVSIEDISDRAPSHAGSARFSQQPTNMLIEEPDSDADDGPKLHRSADATGAPAATPSAAARAHSYAAPTQSYYSYSASSSTTTSSGGNGQPQQFTQHFMSHEDLNGVTASTRLYRDSASCVERAAIRHGLKPPASSAGSVQQRAIEQRAERINGQTTQKFTNYHHVSPQGAAGFHQEWQRRARQSTSLQHALPSKSLAAKQRSGSAHLPAARSSAPQYHHERYTTHPSQRHQYLTH